MEDRGRHMPILIILIKIIPELFCVDFGSFKQYP